MTGRGMIENPTMKQASYSLTPPFEWQINIYCYFLFHTQSSGFSHQTNGNFSQRVRHGKFKNAQKNIERPEGAMVYVSMDNTSEGIIEGNTANAWLSDLSPLPIFGGGETRHENVESCKGRGADVVAPPRLQSLL